MSHELTHVFRRLRKNPGFSVIAIGILALGIGGTVALFSVVHALLLRPLPYANGDRLAVVWETGPRDIWARMGASILDYEDWRSRRTGFDEMAAYYPASFNFATPTTAERVEGQIVSSSYFSLLGVNPVLGRAFTREEDAQGAPRLVVVTHGFWVRSLGRDSSIIGRDIQLNGGGFTVVGVLPPTFRAPTRDGKAEVFAPLGLLGGNLRQWRATHPLTVLARTRPGVSLATAARDVNAAAQSIWSTESLWKGWRLTSVPLRDELVGDLRTTLVALWAAAGLVLAVTCANLANLLITRGVARRREFAVRVALGASRAMLMRDVLGEAAIIAVSGGALGLLLAVVGVRVMRSSLGDALPQLSSVGIDVWVLAYACGIVFVTGLLFGFAPAASAGRVAPQESLRAGARASGSRRSSNVRGALVATQIAFSLSLLIAASLLVRSLNALSDVNPGFRAEDVLTFRVTLPPATYRDGVARVAAVDRIRAGLTALPGVAHVGYGSSIPFAEPGTNRGTSVFVEGRALDDRSLAPSADVRVISDGYLEALGARIVSGRNFRLGDDSASTRVALISATMARRVWPDADPIGAQIRTGDDSETLSTVVGVVDDMRNRGLREQSEPEVYVPFRQRPSPAFTIVVRSSNQPAKFAAVQSVVNRVDPALPIYDFATMTERVDRSIAVPALAARLASGLATLGGILAMLGLYGVVAYSVSQRTREFAVRMALGAQQRDVLWLVVRNAFVLVVSGIAAGLLLASAGTDAFQGLLFGISAVDVRTYVVVAAGLSAVAVAASCVPALRAARVEPLVALREN